MKKFGLKCIAVILAVLMLTGFALPAAAETEVPDSAAAGGTVDYPCDETEADLPAESREPFAGNEQDCRIHLNYPGGGVSKGERVKIVAVGSYIDITEPEACPVEGDVRIVPVKWIAKRDDRNKIIDSGEWTDMQTVQAAYFETADIEIDIIDGTVKVVVEVEFVKQEYKDGKWETIGEYKGSNTTTVSVESVRSYIERWKTIKDMYTFFTGTGRFGLSVVSRAINDFIEEHFNSSTVGSSSGGGFVFESLETVIIMIVEFFEDVFPWSK